MGCWNGTDGFGGMPIRYGDKIKAVIIQNNIGVPEASGFCYLNGYALPISFVIDGVYNDYGSIERVNKNSISSKLLLDFINRELDSKNIKIEPDFQDTKKITYINDLESFIELVERDRVFRKQMHFNSSDYTYTNLGIMFFSDEIYQELLYGNSLSGMRTDVEYFNQDILSSTKLSKESSEILEFLEKKDDKDEVTLKMIDNIKIFGRHLPNYWQEGSRKKNKGFNYVSELSSFSSVNVQVFKDYYLSLKKGSFDSKEIEDMLFDFLSIIRFMHGLRRCWGASSGKGGQDFDQQLYLSLANSIKKQATKYH